MGCIMSTLRLNITLPATLSKKLDELIGPRKKSRFIAETLQEKIEEIEHEQIQAALKEGYQAAKKEGTAITEGFEAADLEGWDDY